MRVATLIAVLLGAAVLTGTALAEGPPQPPPIPTPEGVPQNPWPGKKANGVFFYVETVTASPRESIYGKWAPQACTQTNFFARGERAVFHISAVNTRNSQIVTNADVKYAYLKIPGMNNVPVTFVPHGKDPNTSPWTWTARWDIPPDYPLGIVPFQLVMKLKDWTKNKVATFTQMPLAPENMTVIDHR